jgi:hypothetical protein
MDVLQMSWLLILPMSQEYKILADQNQQPPEIAERSGNALHEGSSM